MAKTLFVKRVSYGVVELVDTESSWGQRYSLHINGQIRSQSNNLAFMKAEFDRLY